MSWRSTLSDSVVSSSGGTMSGLQELKKCNEDFMALKATLKEQLEEGLMDEKLYGIMVKQGEKALKREVAKIAGGGSNAPRGQGKQVMKVEKVKKRQREDGEEEPTRRSRPPTRPSARPSPLASAGSAVLCPMSRTSRTRIR